MKDKRIIKKWLREILKEIIKDGMKNNTRPFVERRKQNEKLLKL